MFRTLRRQRERRNDHPLRRARGKTKSCTSRRSSGINRFRWTIHDHRPQPAVAAADESTAREGRVRGPGGCPGQRLRGRTDLRLRRSSCGGCFRQRSAHAPLRRAAGTDCALDRNEYHQPHQRPDTGPFAPISGFSSVAILRSILRSVICYRDVGFEVQIFSVASRGYLV